MRCLAPPAGPIAEQNVCARAAAEREAGAAGALSFFFAFQQNELLPPATA